MLDEQSIQLSRCLVAHLDGAHLQDVTGVVEPGESGPKHDPDPARSGLAVEVDRLNLDLQRNLYALLSQRISTPDSCSKTRRPSGTTEHGAGVGKREVMKLGQLRLAALLSLSLILSGCGSGKVDPQREAARA